MTDEMHHMLALWAAVCAEHVLPHFEQQQPFDERPRFAIETLRAWVRGEVSMTESRTAAGHAMAAARPLLGAARFAAYSAGQAAAVAHVAAHDLGAAAYAIKAVRASCPAYQAILAGSSERDWQRLHLPKEIRALVLEDQHKRNNICWKVFEP